MVERHDYVALEWVRGEIQETLNLARQALESYVESPEDSSQMRFCLAYLHQVTGTLQMVEFFGAALLSEEMEKLSSVLVAGEISATEDTLSVLMQAILQLPTYLDKVKQSQKDVPVILLPLLNELRSARGEALMSETALFTPNLSPARQLASNFNVSKFNQTAIQELLRKLRQMFQYALIGVFRGKDVQANLSYLIKVFNRLSSVCAGSPKEQLWVIAEAYLIGLQGSVDDLTSASRLLLKRLDITIKDLVERRAESLSEFAEEDLLKNLLYYVGKSQSQDPKVKAVQESYQLLQALPEGGEDGSDQMSGPDADTIESVVSALMEELASIKDSLDIMVRGKIQDVSALTSLIPDLKHVADTMAVLGLGIPRRVLLEQIDVINGMVENTQSLTDAALMDIAGALLYVEATLSGLTDDTPKSSQNQTGVTTAHEAVIREARNGLESTKEAITEFIGSQFNPDTVSHVPALLQSIRGGLQMIPLTRVAAIVTSSSDYILKELIEAGHRPSWEELDTLADAITGVEYYLERIGQDGSGSNTALLEKAENSVAQLGYKVSPIQEESSIPELTEEVADELQETNLVEPNAEQGVAAESEAPELESSLSLEADETLNFGGEDTNEVPESVAELTEESQPVIEPIAANVTASLEIDSELIDDDIIEIFLEEVEEVLANINEYFPQYKANYDDTNALTEFRRAYHTLKGSGRMVGATTIGELAWSIENMLNRLIDETISPTPALIEVVEQVTGYVPELVEKFRKGDNSETNQSIALAEKAHAIAKSEWQDSTVEPVVNGLESETSKDLSSDIGAEGDDVSEDSPLIAVFRNELDTHMRVVEAFINQAEQAGGDYPLSDKVQRALHTVKGSAHMAGLDHIADLAAPVEKMIKELQEWHVPVNDQVCSVLTETLTRIRLALASFESGDTELDDQSEFLSRVDALHHQLLDSRKDLSDGIDPNLMQIFMSESIDIMLDSEQMLNRWQSEDLSHDELLRLHSELLTLAGASKAVDLNPVVSLSEAMANLYKQVLDHQIRPEDEFFDIAKDGQEELICMMDRLAAGQSIHQKNKIEEKLYALATDYENKAQAASATIQIEQELSEPLLGLEGENSPELGIEDSLELGVDDNLELSADDNFELDIEDPDLGSEDSLELDIEGSLDLSIEDDLELDIEEPVQGDAVIDIEADAVVEIEEEIIELEDDDFISSGFSPAKTTERSIDESLDALAFGELDYQDEPAAEEIETDLDQPELENESILGLSDVSIEDEDELDLGDLNLDVEDQNDDDSVESISNLSLDDLDIESSDIQIETESEGDQIEISVESDADDLMLPSEDELNALNIDDDDDELGDFDPSEFEQPESDAWQNNLNQQPVPEFTETNFAPLTPVAAGQTEQVEGDEDLVGIFLEEANDILENIDGCYSRWQDNLLGLDPVLELQRELHTLKGGARMAEIQAIGDLAHELEFLYEDLCNKKYEAEAPLLTLCSRCHDRLADMVQEVESSMTCTSAPDLVQMISEWRQNPGSIQIIEPAPVPEVPVASFDDENEATAEETSDMRMPSFAETLDQLDPRSDGEVEEGAVDLTSDFSEIEVELNTPEPLSTERPTTVNTGPEGQAEDEAFVTEDALMANTSLEFEGDEIDFDILEIFVDEANELMQELDQAISQWQESPDDSESADEMKRVLHTLKGGARLAKIKTLGNLSHEFESFIINAQRNRIAIDEEFFGLLLNRYDELSSGIEEMQNLLQEHGVSGAIGPSVIAQVDEEIEALEPEQAPEPEQTSASPVAGLDEPVAVESEAAPASSSNNVVPFQKKPEPPQPPAQDNDKSKARAQPQETVKVNSGLLENLVNLAGETSIARSRLEQQVSDFGFTLEEMESTIERMRDQVRRLDIETEAQISYRQEIAEESDYADFDPLEMDRYSSIQQLSRSLMEAASDLLDLKSSMTDKTRDAETMLLQQSRINTELQEGLMQTRMVPFNRIVPRLRRIVRQVSGELGKSVEFHVHNGDSELDRAVLERMISPLEHMLRNAVDHGIEMPDQRQSKGKGPTGTIEMTLAREGGDAVLRIQDDGAGIDVERVRQKAVDRGLIQEDQLVDDKDLMNFILSSGFSTADQVTQISGRGVGMDVVHSEVKQLGGTMAIDTTEGSGTSFVITLPVSVSVNRALMVTMGEDIYAIPLDTIEGIVRVTPSQLADYYRPDAEAFEYAGGKYTVNYLGNVLGSDHQSLALESGQPVPLILVKGGGNERSLALHVDALMGSREIVVKPLGPQFSEVSLISGATILGDGSVVVIVDLSSTVRQGTLLEANVNRMLPAANDETTTEEIVPEVVKDRPPLIMVTDDSVTVRKVTTRLLERNGMDVVVAKDGADAMLLLQDHNPDLMLLDIEMPRMDGFEVAQRVRHDSRLKNMPIIMITSRTGHKHKERALSIGVNEYMGKPFQEGPLLDTIERLLKQD